MILIRQGWSRSCENTLTITLDLDFKNNARTLASPVNFNHEKL
jgi:hypothetical protein